MTGSRAFVLRLVAWCRRRSRRVIEPHILFPSLAVLILGVIWGTTLDFVAIGRVEAASDARKTSRQLAATYEAQVLHALREIDQALKVVRYTVETTGPTSALADLSANGLLPPDLVYAVAVADASGHIVASTRASLKGDVATADYFDAQRAADRFFVGVPRERAGSADRTVEFSRRLARPDGRFDGIVFMSVDASHFVSGYEPEKFGVDGMLGLLGTDGIYRARRIGERVTAGEAVDYAALMVDADEDGVAVREGAVVDPKDRFTTALKLYDMPLVVVVGLSRAEQFATTDHDARVYLWRAAGGSAVVVALLAVLGRMSRALARGRQRAAAEQAMHAERVERLAYHDALTSLPNRSMFSRLLQQRIAHARRHGRRLAVLFLDLDRFKQINDTLGHDAGDALLKEVAVRLGTCLRSSDTVARLGGDEFVALLPELDDQRYAATVAIKILAVLAEPFDLMGQEVRVTASIGISTYPNDGLDETTLTKNADIAMYQAKAGGKNNFQFYATGISPNTVGRLALEAALRHALQRDEFEIAYRPRSDGGGVTALEAELRWQHPERGPIERSAFMPIAEEIGLVVPIGDWMLRTICEQHVAWRRIGVPVPVVAMQVAARHLFDDHFVATLAGVLGASGMTPQALELVVDERSLMLDVPKAVRALPRLRELGVRIAVDRFGAAYATLASLGFPFDTITIDRSLAREGPGALVDALVAVGHTLCLDVGTTDPTAADRLDGVTAFDAEEPMSADDVPQRLRSRARLESPESSEEC